MWLLCNNSPELCNNHPSPPGYLCSDFTGYWNVTRTFFTIIWAHYFSTSLKIHLYKSIVLAVDKNETNIFLTRFMEFGTVFSMGVQDNDFSPIEKTNSMKQTLIILAMTAMMVSCKNKAKDETKVLSASEVRDSIEFVKFKETKARNEAAAAARAANTATVNNTPAAAPAAAPKKKGWSKAAKGAVIGGAAGAVAGAIINKRNRAVGAVVGGVVGGGVGYGVGRAKDKKDGRN